MSLRTRLQRLQRAAEGHHAERQADEALRTALERARARVDAWARQEAIETGDLEEDQRRREIRRAFQARRDADPRTVTARQTGDLVTILRAGRAAAREFRALEPGEGSI